MLDNADYDGVYGRYRDLLSDKGGILLDLGCGTGELSKRFAAEGFDVIGVDASEEMLSIAAGKAEGQDIRFIRQDIRKLDLYGTVNITVAAFDVLNHLYTLPDLRSCFERVALFTEPGGVFLFDYNTVYKHREILGSNIFNFDYEDFFCSWENDCEGSEVTMNINVFEKTGEMYRRFCETITETAFPPEAIKKLLTDCGFTVETFDFDTGGKPHEKTERLLFSAKKA
jgi:SAM-dependent methyltransferase